MFSLALFVDMFSYPDELTSFLLAQEVILITITKVNAPTFNKHVNITKLQTNSQPSA